MINKITSDLDKICEISDISTKGFPMKKNREELAMKNGVNVV